MKQNFYLLSVMLLVLFGMVNASAANVGDTIAVEPYKYIVKADGTLKLIKATPAASMVVPASVKYNNDTFRVTEIADMTFYGMSAIQKMTIEEGVETIGDRAFMQAGVKEFNLPVGLKYLGNSCCYNTPLPKIILPEGLERVEPATFRMCRSLRKVTFPSTMKFVDYFSFMDSPLDSIISYAAVPPGTDVSTFKTTIYSTCVLKVPMGSVELYRNAREWGSFEKIVSDVNDGVYVRLNNRVGKAKIAINKPAVITFNITNGGTVTVNTITYTYTLNNVTKTQTYALPEPLLSMASTDVNLTFDTLTQEGTYDMTIAINEANGEVNPGNTQPYTFTFEAGEIYEIPEGAVPFSYFTGTEASDFIGAGVADRLTKVAMRIDDKFLVGKQIAAIKIDYLQNFGIEKLTGWLSSTLGTTPDILSVAGEPEGSSALMVLKTPYAIPQGGLFVGYDIQSSSTHPVPMALPQGIPNTMFYSFNGGEKFYDGSVYNYGCATITVYLVGDFQPNAAGVRYAADGMVMPNQAFPSTFTLVNEGTNAVSSVGYTYSLNGQTIEGSMDVNLPAKLGASKNFTINLEGLAQTGTYPLNMTLSTVNGAANTSQFPSETAKIRVLSFRPANHPLMEEGTGTWCQWCTRGWLAMKLMNEKYDGFVGVAWHNGDPMTITTSTPFNVTGYPGAVINRASKSMDPYYGTNTNEDFGIYNTYAKWAENLAPASISVASEWNGDKSKLTVQAKADFACSFDDLKIGYLLGQDGYCYPDLPAWDQSNAYYDRHDDGYLSEICNMGNPIKGLTFDDVVISDIAARGVAASLPETTQDGKSYYHDYEFDTTSITGIINYDEDTPNGGFELLTNKDNVFVVAYLLTSDGRVLNACKAKAGQGVVTSISTLDNDQETIYSTYYDLQGREIANPQHGIYVRLDKKANGSSTAVKVVK